MSGQIPADTSGTLVEGSITDKTRKCCENLKAILEASGSEIGKVVRCGVSLSLIICTYSRCWDMECREGHRSVELGTGWGPGTEPT